MTLVPRGTRAERLEAVRSAPRAPAEARRCRFTGVLAPGLGLSLALWLAGCTSTETGNPPAQPETGLDATQIQFVLVPNMGDPGLLSGGADPILAAGGSLRITAVETAFDTIEVPIGVEPVSFSASLPAGFEGWLRLQVIPVAGAPLGPLDVLTGDIALGGVEPLEGPLAECLLLDRAVSLGDRGVAQVRLQSRCPEPLSFAAAVARRGLVEIDPTDPFELPPGGRVTLDVSALEPFGPDTEELVILREAGGERRAITVTP